VEGLYRVSVRKAEGKRPMKDKEYGKKSVHTNNEPSNRLQKRGLGRQ
jgi:hypothetical protein